MLPIYKALLYKISAIEIKKDAGKKNKDLESRGKHAINDFESSDDSRGNEEDFEDVSVLKGKRSPSRSKSQQKGKNSKAAS